MTRTIMATLALVTLGLEAPNLMAIEEAEYSVVKQEGRFELRDYTPYILAEVAVEGEFEEAGNLAFRRLFKYISGNNGAGEDVAMTAPVTQQGAGEEISMTAPVSQRRERDRYVVSFMMPAKYTMETIPRPNDPSVTLRRVPAHRMAVVRYSGLWSEKNYLNNKAALASWIGEQGLVIEGEPVWARYNAPFSLWFLRRNEILIPVAAD